MLKLQDIMTRNVETVSPDLSLRDAMELFIRKHIGGAPVVSGQKVVGVLTASDLLAFAASLPHMRVEQSRRLEWAAEAEVPREFEADDDEPDADYLTAIWSDTDAELDGQLETLAGSGWSALDEHSVAEAMSSDVRSLSGDTEVAAAAEFMRKAGIHRVLVMQGDKLEGIVSTMDIVRAVAGGRVPPIRYVPTHELDFDPGWSHEPIVPEE